MRSPPAKHAQGLPQSLRRLDSGDQVATHRAIGQVEHHKQDAIERRAGSAAVERPSKAGDHCLDGAVELAQLIGQRTLDGAARTRSS